MSTQITTGKVRFSYCNLFTPRAVQEGATPKYSVTLLIPKSDKATMHTDITNNFLFIILCSKVNLLF